MENKQRYTNRRLGLMKSLNSGVVLLQGNVISPRNFNANQYAFRQDSTFYYYTGITMPGLALILDLDTGKTILFGEKYSVEDEIWTGKLKPIEDVVSETGIDQFYEIKQLESFIGNTKNEGKKVHFLYPYQCALQNKLSKLFNIEPEKIKEHISLELLNSVIAQREIKEDWEVEQIEKTISGATAVMFHDVIKSVKPGVNEREIVGNMHRYAESLGNGMAFAPIVSVRGEILHNPNYNNELKNGDLLLVDAGIESTILYATDITRTFPVSGKYTKKQSDVYQIVLNAQKEAINKVKEGISFKDIHYTAAICIAGGLKDLGLLMGDVNELVSIGAHALFFPHGIGHLMGLDVHDMECFGEEHIGYNNEVKRETQFGINHLRFGRALKKNHVVTIEPGIYFNPVLVEKWKADGLFKSHINYAEITKYYDFGGIRIEDDILVTNNGTRVLGKSIPKEIAEIEEIMQA